MCRELSSQHGVEISFHAERIPVGLSRHLALCLYRVLQEALQNAIKHSGSAKVEVSLRCEVDSIELTIRDFGAGFDVATNQGRGLGLTSMKERLEAVNGRLVLKSQPRHGTTIQAFAPLSGMSLETNGPGEPAVDTTGLTATRSNSRRRR
jgi:signal transduction histidine kinase